MISLEGFIIGTLMFVFELIIIRSNYFKKFVKFVRNKIIKKKEEDG